MKTKFRYMYTIIIVLLITYLLTGCTKIEIPTDIVYRDNYMGNYQFEEDICLAFIQNKLTSPQGGIISNYIPPGSNSILSESEGLIMLYYLRKNNKTSYDKHLNFVTNYLLLNKGIVSWKYTKYSNGKYELSPASASIDDLRIIRSLIYAYNKWGDNKYKQYFNKITRGLIYFQTKGNLLVDGYDDHYNRKINKITLSYIDLYTIKLIADKNNTLYNIYNKNLNLILNGYISNNVPFYHEYYNPRSHQYIKSNTINILNNLLITLHLSEVNQVNNYTINWLTNRFEKDGAIYTEYNKTNLEPVNKIESTAIYAILARIYKNTGDLYMYQKAIKKMLSFQVKDSKSKIYGSFGNNNTLSSYSFDNLQALLAF